MTKDGYFFSLKDLKCIKQHKKKNKELECKTWIKLNKKQK